MCPCVQVASICRLHLSRVRACWWRWKTLHCLQEGNMLCCCHLTQPAMCLLFAVLCLCCHLTQPAICLLFAVLCLCCHLTQPAMCLLFAVCLCCHLTQPAICLLFAVCVFVLPIETRTVFNDEEEDNWSVACINWVSRKKWIWENRHWSCGHANG